MYRILFRTLAAGLVLGGALAAGAQTHDLTARSDDGATVAVTPVAASAEPQHPASEFQPLAARRWEFGPFVNYGNGLIDRTDFHFFALGFQAGRMMSPMIHAGPLSGRFELGANVMPLFQAYTPAAHDERVPVGGGTITQRVAGGTYTGVSVTPVVFRWNFATASPRFSPWFQAQGAVLYTTHKFPPTVEGPEGTSVWNFRSGAGIGFHYFTRPRRSLDFALNAEHISSASLGDKNPGVNASLQFQVGYTWWK